MGRQGRPRPPQAEGGCGAARPSLLWALPEELLLLICSYLDAQALGRLGQVCRRLRAFSGRDPLWRRIARGCLNSGFSQLGADLAAGIPVKERVKVSQNWRHGRCRRETLLKWKRNLMPWMHLDGEYLYLSQAEDIRAYRFRPDSAGLQRHPQAIFSGHHEDVCRFVLASSHIVSGGGDGNIVLSKVHSSFSIKFSAHEQEVNCVDCQGGIIVSGSRDRTAKVWSLSSGRAGHCLHTVQTEDRVWSIAISPLLSSFVTGTACCGHTSPLRIWDLESGQLATCLGTDFHRGAGVLDVVYETPFTLLSCGYDTYIRSWDLRYTPRKCVMEWEEPHDSALYCVRSDGNHMIASGSAYYGVVRLWDKRQSRCLQSFSLSSPTSSPVYCLRFTTTYLYAALASALHALDFTAP
ncbi:F-box/WD repeat-containing protein 4 isoform X2 [Dermochelys coriacea]|uniref:F-box/WD repeat-containing protein 4 isoform X2 n=1 Tax=Dermochelys coriacea TaxID=27794 RepID=UPI0018E75B11|nr:F-box/WD repeat-containing protein 4 isoform X2 [Dermochelys coriacea]